MLLPGTHRTYTTNDGSSNFKLVGRAIQSLRQVPGRFSGVRFQWRWGWNRLEENNQRRVSPYLAPASPPVIEVKARRSRTLPMQERRLSEETLVPSVRGSETSDQSDTTDMSLVVNVPSSEKGAKDAADTPLSQIDVEACK